MARCYSARVMLRHPSALALGLIALLVSTATAAPPSPAPMLPRDLRPGQKAVVRTVFSGDRIESFDAEIVGVLHGGRTEGDMILARATSERVQKLGVAQGMSGSPVYVDGRLVGALSSGWPFSREPLFGITPISEMLPVLDLPAAPGDNPSAGPSGAEPPGLAAPPRFRELRWEESDAPETPAAAPAGELEGLQPLALPLACGGLHPAAIAAARDLFAPLHLTVVPGGRAAGGGPTAAALEPGSAVAVDVMRGDLQMSAIGTVTYRDGDRVLIFGHPFFQAGDVKLPLSTAEIVTIVPSEISSFKLGVPGREIGTATQDRRTAVAGRIGPAPRLLPLAVRVIAAGRPRQSFRFEAIEDRSLAPALVGVAALNSVLESGGSGGGQTLRWRLGLVRRGLPRLELQDVSSGDVASSELVGAITSPLRFLFNTPYERPRLDSLELEIRTEPGREQWALRSARLLSAAVRPGGEAHLRCSLERWRGGREVRDVVLQVPEELPGGRYVIWLGGGAELNRFEASKLPARYRPTSFADAWSRLAHSRSSDALYAALIARAPEVTSDGRDYPELPISALMLLGSPIGAGERGRRGDSAMLEETRFDAGGQLRGELQLELVVDPTAP